MQQVRIWSTSKSSCSWSTSATPAALCIHILYTHTIYTHTIYTHIPYINNEISFERLRRSTDIRIKCQYTSLNDTFLGPCDCYSHCMQIFMPSIRRRLFGVLVRIGVLVPRCTAESSSPIAGCSEALASDKRKPPRCYLLSAPLRPCRIAAHIAVLGSGPLARHRIENQSPT